MAQRPVVSPRSALRDSTFVLVTMVAVGCGPATPPVSPSPKAGPPAPPPTGAVAPHAWSPRYTAGRWRYAFTSHATVTVLNDSTAPASDIANQATVTVSLATTGSERLQLHILVDSFTATRPSTLDSATMPNAPQHPHLEEVVTPRGVVIVDSSAIASTDSSCAGASPPLLPGVRRIIVALPTTLTPGTSWRDTSVAQTCRGTTLLEETRTTTYRVIGLTRLAGTSVLQLERSATIDVRTPMADSTRHLGVEGHGTSTGILYIDPIDAMLTNSHDETTITLSVTVGRSSVVFRQAGRQEVTRQ